MSDSTQSHVDLAAAAVRRVVADGHPPNGTAPESCGPYEEPLRLLYEAHAEGGTDAARLAWTAIAAEYTDLVAAVAGSEQTANLQNRKPATRTSLAEAVARWGELGSAEDVPQVVYNALPSLVTRGAAYFERKAERDAFTLASLPLLGGLMPNVEGQMSDGYHSPNTYLAILAPASAGKGAVKFARRLGEDVAAVVREEYEIELELWVEKDRAYQKAMRAKSAIADDPGPRPVRRDFFLPANTSATEFCSGLEANGGRATVFEAEADTLTKTTKQEWGALDDVLRAGWSYDPVSIRRRTEYIHVARPNLSICLTGTPEQFFTLIPSAENGLFSRFGFFYFDAEDEWRSQRPTQRTRERDDYMASAAARLKDMNGALRLRSHPLYVEMTAEMWEQHDEALSRLKAAVLSSQIKALVPTVHRAGVTAFRLAMVLRVLRAFEAGVDLSRAVSLEVGDEDLVAGLEIALLWADHAFRLSRYLSSSAFAAASMPPGPAEVLDSVADEFRTADALAEGERLGVPERTIYDYLSPKSPRSWIGRRIEKTGRGQFRKLSATDVPVAALQDCRIAGDETNRPGANQ